MPQEWENGNAAREYDAQQAPNLFTPIDFAARLQSAGKRRRSSMGSTYQPGQTYGAPSAPPMAAPDYEAPSYLQQQTWMPAQEWQPSDSAPVQELSGAPYSASLFAHQTTAVMPKGMTDAFFADPPAQGGQQSAPMETPVWDEELPGQDQPVYYAEADIPLRDPFTPAQPRPEAQTGKQPTGPARRKAASPHGKRPVNPLEWLLRATAGVLLAISIAVGGPMIAEIARNEREFGAFRAEYEEENGVDVYHGAAKVDLPPAGQTFAPTPSPAPTEFKPTPSPSPVIPLPAALLENPDEELQAEEPTETPVPLRTKLMDYPKNPMRNVVESLREMAAENEDVVGRLVIPGVLDEMVMQRTNTYYLTHNAIGAGSEAGAVFADESCVFRHPPENLLLRGQSGVPGKTFAPLWQYISGGREFVAGHTMAALTTLYEEESYYLFAVIVASSDPVSANYFNYASHPTFTTDEAMLRYVEEARAHSVYQFNVDVAVSDRLLTLATLDAGENTLVLMYRMVRENENLGM